MKSILLAAIFLIASVFLSFTLGRDLHFAIIVLATILGFVIGKVFELQQDVKSLRQAFSKDWQQRNEKEEQAFTEASLPKENMTKKGPSEEALDSSDTSVSESETGGIPDELIKQNNYREQSDAFEADEPLVSQAAMATNMEQSATYSTLESSSDSIRTAASTTGLKSSATKYKPVEPDITDKAWSYIKSYFTGGNLFVRVGIIILFFGVSFLLKYVSDRGFFPIEYRLMAVVAAAIFLLGLGWRLRHKNPTYALLLQGAGIGILYLDIYAAFSMYHLLDALPAFVLLFVVSMLSAALAVLQDSKSLAVLGFSGGFLAPVLASSGSNNHVGLFSYYAVLNIAIVAIAWFKAWRPLNLLGFAFTFIIGAVWGVFSYNDNKFATTEPFLILFFLFYVLIAVLFALRQPPKLKGYVDGTLLFGVPLAASALQYSLVKDYQYGVSISAFAMGAFYLVLAWFLWKRAGEGLKLLSEAFLALGVIFASMAIPFALAPTQTAAAWGIEGLGLLWLGSRQNRLSVRVFGLLLQIGAGFFVFMRHDFSQDAPFLNGTFISTMMMAVAGIFSARLLDKLFEGKKVWETTASPLLLVWGLLWLFGGFAHQITTHYAEHWLPTNLLIVAAVMSFGFTLVAQRLKPEWKHAWYAASGLLAVMLLVALAQFANQSLSLASRIPYHPLQLNGWIAWPLAFAAGYYLLKQLEQHQVLPRLLMPFHTLALLLLVALITLEGRYLLASYLSLDSDWFNIWFAVPATLVLWMIVKSGFWPFSGLSHNAKERQLERQQGNQTLTGLVLAAFLMLWGFQALISQGNPVPLSWIPLLNPLDITLGVVLITLVKWWKTISPVLTEYNSQNKIFNKRVALISFGLLVFLWLNFTLFRVVHHWFDVPYTFNALYNSSLVQPAVSILWAISGVLLTVYSSRKNMRVLWLAGGVILVLVVLKLFVIDLSELGSLARIISFLVVGALLTSIGYFAPLPEKDENKGKKGEKMSAKKDGDEEKMDA